MSNSPPGFVFVPNAAAFSDPAALVVRLPGRLRHRRELFDAYRVGLALPDYFGENWDALEECLRDLSWLPEAQRVALVHVGLPFARSTDLRRIYLQLLRDLVSARSSGETREVLAVFPDSASLDICETLGREPS